jgi:hypothetical protein
MFCPSLAFNNLIIYDQPLARVSANLHIMFMICRFSKCFWRGAMVSKNDQISLGVSLASVSKSAESHPMRGLCPGFGIIRHLCHILAISQMIVRTPHVPFASVSETTTITKHGKASAELGSKSLSPLSSMNLESSSASAHGALSVRSRKWSDDVLYSSVSGHLWYMAISPPTCGVFLSTPSAVYAQI